MRKTWSILLTLIMLLSIDFLTGKNHVVLAEENSFSDELATITVDKDTKIYSEPNQDTKGLAYIMEGDSIQQIAVSDDWIQVIWDNNYGYILRSDIESVTESEKLPKNPQEIVLDEYFEAVNNFDRERISELCNNEAEAYEAAHSVDISNYDYYVQRLGFGPGFLHLLGGVFTSDDTDIEILEGYGYKGDTADEMRESYLKDINEDGKTLFSVFHASYELLELKKAEECKNYYMVGLKKKYIPDMKDKIKTDLGLESIDDVYVAKLKIYWEYCGFPYGCEEKIFDSLSEEESFESFLKKRMIRSIMLIFTKWVLIGTYIRI